MAAKDLATLGGIVLLDPAGKAASHGSCVRLDLDMLWPPSRSQAHTCFTAVKSEDTEQRGRYAACESGSERP